MNKQINPFIACRTKPIGSIIPQHQGVWFNIKNHLTSIGNPIVEIRRSYDRLISTMRFPILVRWHLYIEAGPCRWLCSFISVAACVGLIDLVIMVDSSGSIGPDHFVYMLDFTKAIISSMNLNTARVGVLNFNTMPDLRFHLNAYNNTRAAIDATSWAYNGGSTNTGAALQVQGILEIIWCVFS